MEEILEDIEVRKKIITIVNKHIDIPILSQETEALIINDLCEAIVAKKRIPKWMYAVIPLF